jgi:transglutaminase-like putative cysteine protease
MRTELKVTHTTGFTYEGGAQASYNEARMTPVTMPGQLVLSTRLEVRPTPWVNRYRDYWGTLVTAFEVHESHRELMVSATSTVQLERGTPHLTLPASWADLSTTQVGDQFCEFLALSPRVRPGVELGRVAKELSADARDPREFARELCALVHREVDYVTGSTEVHTLAADAWETRQGVCQDLAHLCIGALRDAGVPARYVSGYLHPRTDPEIGETVVGESHAWIEWWDGAWTAFDPTNQTVPDNRYVVVASGRDYGDVAPLTGIFSGGQTSSMFVEVTVTRTR